MPETRNVPVLFLTGRDLNEHPTHEPSRWAINFFDWPIDVAEKYVDCFAIVERLVRPVREKVSVRRIEGWLAICRARLRDSAIARFIGCLQLRL